MPSFKCVACGRSYFSEGNYIGCPYCGGFGDRRMKPSCTCPCALNFFGGVRIRDTNQPANPTCLIHGQPVVLITALKQEVSS